MTTTDPAVAAARDLLLGEHAGEQVADAAQLAAALLRLLQDPARRNAMGDAGRRAVVANRGALQKLLVLLDRV